MERDFFYWDVETVLNLSFLIGSCLLFFGIGRLFRDSPPKKESPFKDLKLTSFTSLLPIPMVPKCLALDMTPCQPPPFASYHSANLKKKTKIFHLVGRARKVYFAA
jgi:hypothetical protein